MTAAADASWIALTGAPAELLNIRSMVPTRFAVKLGAGGRCRSAQRTALLPSPPRSARNENDLSLSLSYFIRAPRCGRKCHDRNKARVNQPAGRLLG